MPCRWAILLALVAVSALSACRVDAILTIAVQANGTGTLRMEAVADAELVDRATRFSGTDPIEEFIADDLEAAGWMVTRDIPNHRLAIEHGFRGPAELSALITGLDPSGTTPVLRGFSLERRHSLFDDRFRLSGTVDLSQGASAEPLAVVLQGTDPAIISDVAGADISRSFQMTVAALLPGDTQRTNAPEFGGSRYTWKALPGAAVALQVETRRRNVLALGTAAGVVVLVLVVLTLLVTVAVSARRSHRGQG